jgi:acetyltransferase-like isoleucine patch superfamily enzyme
MSLAQKLTRALKNPRLAIAVGCEIINGLYYRAKYKLLMGRRIRIGRGFRVAGRLDIRGPGTVIFGDNCSIISSRYAVTTPYTHSREAVLKIGNNVLITGARFGCQKSIEVCDGAGISEARITDTDFHRSESTGDERFDGGGVTAKKVVIGKRAWVGASAIVLKGVRVGDDAVIGAGAVVVMNVPPRSVVFGNPARVIWRLTAPAPQSQAAQTASAS